MPSLAIEISLIGLILFLLHNTVFIGFRSLAGGAGWWLILFFLTVFFIVSIFYIILRLVLAHVEKPFLKWLSMVLLTLPVIVATYFATTSTGGFKLFGLLFLVPLFVLALRYLFLKFLMGKKKRSA